MVNPSLLLKILAEGSSNQPEPSSLKKQIVADSNSIFSDPNYETVKQGAAVADTKEQQHLPTKKEDASPAEVGLDLNGWGEDDLMGMDFPGDDNPAGDKVLAPGGSSTTDQKQ